MWPLFFGFRLFELSDFSKINQLKGLKPKNKNHTNFYQCCDLTEKKISSVDIILYCVCILFSSYHNIHKSSCSLWFLASDPLIDRFK